MSNNPNKKNKRKHKYNTNLCTDDLTFQECELSILRHAVDETEKIQSEKMANSEEIQKIIKITEEFIIKKKLVCYGGSAINNILPKYAQFYDKEIDIPDYDFFSADALENAKELADIYFKEGYTEVEAKSGVHYGTFKVFVNFIAVADITFLHKLLFDAIYDESIVVENIHYAPPNFLRMSMYLELSRPAGDVSRWEKVLKRLTLLNKYYPLLNKKDKCATVDFQRGLDSGKNESEKIYFLTRDIFIEQDVVFFGGYASSLYSKYMPENKRRLLKKNPDFDVLSEDPEKCAKLVVEQLRNASIKHVTYDIFTAIGEIIPKRIEIKVGKDTIAFIYEPIACHNFNTIYIDGKKINIATIDTMLSFYLAFIYTDDFSYYRDRILCMAEFLFDVEEKNRLEQKGLLKRFSNQCYGKQATLEDIRSKKSDKFKELSDKKGTPEYEMWFLKYTPQSNKEQIKGKKETHEKNDYENPENNLLKSSAITLSSTKKNKSKKTEKQKTEKQKTKKNRFQSLPSNPLKWLLPTSNY
jgi:hypothetical protein